MAGLLKQLQKQRSHLDSMREVLLTPEAESSPPGLDAIDRNVLEAKELLGELAAESNQLRGKTPEMSSGPEAKNQDGAPLKSKVPWWLKSSKKIMPQIERLVPEARRILNELAPNDEDEPINIRDAVREAVQLAAQNLREEIRLTVKDEEIAAKELLELLTGKGPLQPLYEDRDVTDIFIDHHRSIKVIRRGQALETPFSFRSPEEYKLFVHSMLQGADRVLNLSSPIVDCVLDDKWRSRVNAIDSSVLDGDEPRICIRVPRLQQISFYDILQTKTLPASVAAWLAEVVALGEANILVVGPTGSGKTVMTTALLSSISSDERIITIEDVPEIFVPTAHLEKLVSRPPNPQGEGAITLPQLLRAALRRAPHRIVVGEIRDEESRLFLRALETGHAGSIATIHADAVNDGLWRLLDLVAAHEVAPQESIMRRISRSVHLVITMHKVDGTPCFMELSEVLEPESGQFVTQPIIKFLGVNEKGKRRWQLMTHNSFWLKRLEQESIKLRTGVSLRAPNSEETPDTNEASQQLEKE